MKKVLVIAALMIVSYSNSAYPATVVYTGTVVASGTDTYGFITSAILLNPFELTLDILTLPLDSFTLDWSVKNMRTDVINNAIFDLTTDTSATFPALPAGPYTSTVMFMYPTPGVSIQYQISIAATVPIPPALYMFGMGLVGILGFARKSRRDR